MICLPISHEMLVARLPNLPANHCLENLPKSLGNQPLYWQRRSYKNVGWLDHTTEAARSVTKNGAGRKHLHSPPPAWLSKRTAPYAVNNILRSTCMTTSAKQLRICAGKRRESPFLSGYCFEVQLPQKCILICCPKVNPDPTLQIFWNNAIQLSDPFRPD